MSLLTAFGLMLVLSGTVVRAVALRRALLFAPVPVPVPVRVPVRVRVPVPMPGGVRRSRRTRPGLALPRLRMQVLTLDRVLFVVCFAVYLTGGALLALHFNSFNGDAQSRVANAFYVLFSRDPHLAAIGFVWNPLPSFLVIPLLLFKAAWPALATRAFAGNIESALFMAVSVCVLHGILADMRLPRPVTLLIAGLFAANPMIVYYGSNGMSEALFLLTLLLATRQLMRWLASGSLRALALAGIWLGVAYLTRNEAIAAGAAMIVLVTVRTYLQSPGARRQRMLAAAADAIIVGTPFVTAFVGWAVAAYIITGHPFQQIAANATQVHLFGETGKLGMSRLTYVILQMLSYAPFLPLITVAAARRAWRTRDLRPLAPAAVLGGVLAFAVLVFITGQTYGWLRYTIAAGPLAAVLAGWLVADGITERGRLGVPRRSGSSTRPWRGRLRRPAIATGIAVALLAPSLPSTAWAMSDPRLGRGERGNLTWVLRGARTASDNEESHRLHSVEKIVRYLDDLRLPDGSIIADTITPCVSWLVLNTRRPRQFIITNDRDFEAVLADPATFHARYLLVPPEGGFGVFDSIRQLYPDLYEHGANLAKLRHEFTAPACPRFRLYEVTGSPTAEPGQGVPTGGGR